MYWGKEIIRLAGSEVGDTSVLAACLLGHIDPWDKAGNNRQARKNRQGTVGKVILSARVF